MKISLTQLQAYNAMHKLLSNYYKRTKDEDTSNLLSGMPFLADGGTADPATWGDWIKAINDKKTLTKQEAFDGLMRFFENYHAVGPYPYTTFMLDQFHSAKSSDDVSVPLVERWNYYVKEALSEPEGTREYFRLMKQTREALVWLRGFNTVYKFLNIYGKQNKSEDVTRLVHGMLFFPERGNVDPEAADTWSAAVDYRRMLTKEETFDGTIRFLETYQERLNSDDIAHLIKILRLAKNCDDVTVPLVQQWDLCFEEALHEPAGAREYLKLTK